ncbi:MAG: hypothetical protein ACI92Z_003366, partial [Paracoccaceae bacterium]
MKPAAFFDSGAANSPISAFIGQFLRPTARLYRFSLCFSL